MNSHTNNICNNCERGQNLLNGHKKEKDLQKVYQSIIPNIQTQLLKIKRLLDDKKCEFDVEERLDLMRATEFLDDAKRFLYSLLDKNNIKHN